MKVLPKLGSSGLTIVELLIVISIVAVLASATIVIFPFIFSQSKDAQRKADLAKIQSDLEKYRNKNGQYPESLEVLYSPASPPDDPDAPNKHYCYDYGSPFNVNGVLLRMKYKLMAKLDQPPPDSEIPFDRVCDYNDHHSLLPGGLDNPPVENENGYTYRVTSGDVPNNDNPLY